MATTILRADIQSRKKNSFFGTSCLRKSGITSALIAIQSMFYAHFKANKMPFLMTCYTNIFSTVMFSRSSNLTFTFDLVFLRMRYFNVFNMLCTCNYYLKYQVGTAVGLGFVKHFTVKSHFTCIDEVTSSNMFLLNSLHLLI
jgi:hypothetical protein